MTLDQVQVRDAAPEDGVSVRRFVFDILCEYGLPADPDATDADVMEFGAPRDPRVVHLVAATPREPVGSAILTPTGEGRVKLSKLFVRKDCRGRSIGRLLLASSIERARTEGYREVFLRTRALYREAVSLYERSGWLRGPDQPPPGPDRLYYYPLT